MYLLIITVGLFLLWGIFIRWDKIREKSAARALDHIVKKPLTSEEIRWIERYCRVWHKLTPREKKRLKELILLFRHDIPFEACGGLREIRPEMKLAVAANACLLLLGGQQPFFPFLREVLIYPNDFIIPEEEIFSDGDEVVMGESTGNGNVILSWPEVKDCGKNPFLHTNVVIHEFAHQADIMERTEQGKVPHSLYWLHSDEHFGPVSRKFVKYWKEFRTTGHGCLDEYAGTDPAEFFAVATEFYFELPFHFASDYPEMYRLMQDIYGKLSYQ